MYNSLNFLRQWVPLNVIMIMLSVGWYIEKFSNCKAPTYSFYPKLCNYFISLLQSSNIEIVEETCSRVERQKTHDQRVIGSNPRMRKPFFMHHSFGSNHGNIFNPLALLHCCTVACAVCNLSNERVDFVDVWHIYGSGSIRETLIETVL